MWTRLRERLWTTPSLFLLFLGVMLLLLGTVVFALPQAVASIDWPTTEGVVLTSAIEEVGWSDNEGCCPSVRYAYTVGGKKYVFDRVEIQSICNGSTDYYAGEVIRRYPVGKRVVVFYNPQNPAFAVLEPGIPDNEFYMPILTILPTFGGIVLFWLGLLSVLGVVKYPKSLGRSSNDKKYQLTQRAPDAWDSAPFYEQSIRFSIIQVDGFAFPPLPVTQAVG